MGKWESGRREGGSTKMDQNHCSEDDVSSPSMKFHQMSFQTRDNVLFPSTSEQTNLGRILSG